MSFETNLKSFTTPSPTKIAPIVAHDGTHEQCHKIVVEVGKQLQKFSTMKLVVRSNYWGRVLSGKIYRPQHDTHSSYHVISSQAFLKKIGDFWGCCQAQGKRVLELNETHFIEHHAGEWDLYFIASCVMNGTKDHCHDFFLLPQNQRHININKCICDSGWSFVGTVHASMLRMELEQLLISVMDPNTGNSSKKSDPHFHIQIMMDSVLDREMSQSIKIKKHKKKSASRNKPKLPKTTAPPPPLQVVSTNSWTTEGSWNPYSQGEPHSYEAYNQYTGEPQWSGEPLRWDNSFMDRNGVPNQQMMIPTNHDLGLGGVPHQGMMPHGPWMGIPDPYMMMNDGTAMLRRYAMNNHWMG
jgi:hypothetical protein